MSKFASGLKLHTPDGDVFDVAEFPSGRTWAVDHPEAGLTTVAVSLDALLEEFPPGTRVERPGEAS
ncbi:hypothetical protein [Streptomyces sp. C3-3]|uniref:hypothetical protein n=1 Tax=Streptomyces sp. C3-3 TaxID=2824901 RepID=UPI001B381654|nr:hypothetical protein [Streptomyces sp. C3-3]MBQ1118334.1 hypothetical protein [Streptomyces sp. C3-3]